MRRLLHPISLFRYTKEYILRRLSLRLGLLIIFIITVVFSLIFNFLFYQAKQYVRQVAIDRANQLLDNTVVRINGIMDETEIVTNYLAATTPQRLHPDSLLAITHRYLEEYPFLTGLAISMEPYYFPEMGRYFSAYSLRQDGTITTVREGPFEYFEKVWYSSPRAKGSACWVDGYDDYNEGTLSSKDYLTSYCCPMRDANGKYVGSITTSLTLKWLSESLTAIQAYPNSSAIMIGRTGIYLVHPDTTKLFKESIFSDAAPEAVEDINVLGKAMLAGHSGMISTIVDGNNAYIFYRPLERTGWSIAIVCPESDVFSRYYQLLYTVWTIIGIGLFLLLLFCYQTIRKAVRPLHLLAHQASLIAQDGNFEEVLPQSERNDSVGRLNNSFSQMQQSLYESVTAIKSVNKELEQHNEELTRAYQLKIEADEQKSAFIQNMSHQIRTPLNIISGFTQVLAASHQERTAEEVENDSQTEQDGAGNLSNDEFSSIFSRMKSSAKYISRIAWMLNASSADGKHLEANLANFACNDLCREVISLVKPNVPHDVTLSFESDVPDTYTIFSDRQSLFTILHELIYNACKFTRQGTITLTCHQNEGNTVSFIVSDTGPGIPDNKREHIFTLFTKLDPFAEGVGLGLPLSRHTARQLGGDLMMDDSYQDGSRFVVTIPVQ